MGGTDWRSGPAGGGLNDGQWHSVHLNILENYAMLTVDGDEASTVRTIIPVVIQTGGSYYFGGEVLPPCCCSQSTLLFF